MKPTLLFVAILGLLAIACKKEAAKPAEVPVQKNAAFHIFASKEYADPVYRSVKTDLHLQVLKINYITGQQTVLWDSVFVTRNVTEFPLYDNKIVITKSFPISDSHEKLNAGYSVKYNDNGYIQQEARSDEATPGQNSVLIEAAL